MPKYLATVRYTKKGMGEARAGGAQARFDAVSTLLEGVGSCKVESSHFALGDTDVFCIVDAPDDEAVAVMVSAINDSGTAVVRTTNLLTAEQVDEALALSMDDQPPRSWARRY